MDDLQYVENKAKCPMCGVSIFEPSAGCSLPNSKHPSKDEYDKKRNDFFGGLTKTQTCPIRDFDRGVQHIFVFGNRTCLCGKYNNPYLRPTDYIK